jgi:ribosomal protein S18 acetylase RimI-like enzyme
VKVRLRSANTDEADVRFLRQMMYEAVAWRPGEPRPAYDTVLADEKISCYVDGWGKAGDFGVISEADDGSLVGAAWYRLFTEDAHGFGFVSPAVPELTIGVSAKWRGQGIGTTMLAALIEGAQAAALPGLSLSVEEDNPAVHLYERAGFTAVARVDNAWTMRLDFATNGV